MSYTIKEIDAEGCVSVAFTVDNAVHRIANLPITDAAALQQALKDWETAYEAGLALTAIPTPPKDVQAMIGKTIG